MSASFTPGPWTLTHRGGSNFAVQTFEIRGMFGDSANTYPIFNRNTSAIDGGLIHTSPANARLIASAPSLLEALQEAGDAMSRLDEDVFGPIVDGHGEMIGFVRDALLARINAAIAAATGAA